MHSGLASIIGDQIAQHHMHPILLLAVVYLVTLTTTEVRNIFGFAFRNSPSGCHEQCSRSDMLSHSKRNSAGVTPLLLIRNFFEVQTSNLNIKPFAVAVAIAASSGYILPIGYQCHLYVMTPGG